ncbi:hypothetical protein K449DRAFT_438966 [Hypoxylon sp. EC38]|nr:hypothetical protein K449DRAFT_438966 [Hypoxylon sp. EC38]
MMDLPIAISIKQATFNKLTSLRYLFYSTQFIRSEVPISAWSLILLGSRERSIDEATFLDVQGRIWDIFRCCHLIYDAHGIGWLGSESFWLIVWQCLGQMCRTNAEDPYGHKYLPHIEEARNNKYTLQRLIDAWNRRTYLQTYWDPRTGSKSYGKRLGSISNDSQFYMFQRPGGDVNNSRPQEETKYDRMEDVTDPGRAPVFEDDDYVLVNEDLEPDSRREPEGGTYLTNTTPNTSDIKSKGKRSLSKEEITGLVNHGIKLRRKQ